MSHCRLLGRYAVLVVGVALGTACGSSSGSSASDNSAGSNGLGGSATGSGGSATGSGGSATGSGGSAIGSGGSSSGGTAGSQTSQGGSTTAGGSGGDATGGIGGQNTAGAAGFIWPDTYDPNGLPNPANGNHNADENCMNCHASMGDTTWLFGGTVHQSDGVTGAAHVEVAVTDGTNTYTTYSATNGNFWVPAAGNSLTWANARAYMRNSNGTVSMGNRTPAAGCNSCHTGGSALIEP